MSGVAEGWAASLARVDDNTAFSQLTANSGPQNEILDDDTAYVLLMFFDGAGDVFITTGTPPITASNSYHLVLNDVLRLAVDGGTRLNYRANANGQLVSLMQVKG